ncbi:MAG: iron chaperone [Rhodoluna sp.]
MTVEDVTAYIDGLEEPKRSTLLAVREIILEIEPSFEQVIAWKSPQFKINGKYAVGICAFKNHLTFSPQSAAVMTAHADKLTDYVTAGSSFQFAIDKPLPKALLKSLIEARLKELQ